LMDEPSTGLTTATPEGAEVSTVKVFTALVVELPAASVWVAVTVWEPLARAPDAGTDHDVPERVALSVWTVVAPCLTTTLTVLESPAALPAVPEKVGVALLVDDPLTGLRTATPTGATESIENVTTELVPVFVAASVCDAVTVYVPSESELPAVTVQAVPERVADSVWTVDTPCFTTTLTVAESPAAFPAVPVKLGVESLMVELSAGAVIVTVGPTDEIVNVLADEVVELPARSVWVAATV
jgi:hypothetical protein